jgi:hypothetical protein
VAQADFINEVRSCGLEANEAFIDDGHANTGLIGIEHEVADGTVAAPESNGLHCLPTLYGQALDIGHAHTDIAPDCYLGPGHYVGTGSHSGQVCTTIPAREVVTTTQTNQHSEGASDVQYNTQGKRGQVYSLCGNLDRSTHTCGTTQ